MSNAPNARASQLKYLSMKGAIFAPAARISPATRKNLAPRPTRAAATKSAEADSEHPAKDREDLERDRREAGREYRQEFVLVVRVPDRLEIRVREAQPGEVLEDEAGDQIPQRHADEVAQHGPQHASDGGDGGVEQPFAAVAQHQGHQQHVGGHGKEAAFGEGDGEQRPRRRRAVRPRQRPIVHPPVRVPPRHGAVRGRARAAARAEFRVAGGGLLAAGAGQSGRGRGIDRRILSTGARTPRRTCRVVSRRRPARASAISRQAPRPGSAPGLRGPGERIGSEAPAAPRNPPSRQVRQRDRHRIPRDSDGEGPRSERDHDLGIQDRRRKERDQDETAAGRRRDGLPPPLAEHADGCAQRGSHQPPGQVDPDQRPLAGEPVTPPGSPAKRPPDDAIRATSTGSGARSR